MGRSRTAVTNLLRLLELSDGVKELVESRELEMGHARALLALPTTKQLEAARLVARKGLSVRETEELVRRALASPKKKSKASPSKDPDVRRLEAELSDKLGAQVTVQHGSKGKGAVTIRYNSLDELDGILTHIR